MCQHERRPLHVLDHICYRKSLAAPGDAKQDLVPGRVIQSIDELPDRLRLVAFWLVLRSETKLHDLIIQFLHAEHKVHDQNPSFCGIRQELTRESFRAATFEMNSAASPSSA